VTIIPVEIVQWHILGRTITHSAQCKSEARFLAAGGFNARYVEKPETLLYFLVDCDRISKNLMFFFPFLDSLVLPAVYKIEKFTNRMDGNPRDIRWS